MTSGICVRVAAGSALGAGLGLLVTLVGLAVAIAILYWGYRIAKKRGYPAWLGLVLAFFLGLIGILILYLLPAKTRAQPAPYAAGYAQYPPPPGPAPAAPQPPRGWSTQATLPPWATQAAPPPAPAGADTPPPPAPES